MTIWYRPAYQHTAASDVNLSRLPQELVFQNMAGNASPITVRIKDPDGTLLPDNIPRVTIVKYGSYMDEDDTQNPDDEVDIMARVQKALQDQRTVDGSRPQLHGFVLEGTSPYGMGSDSQMAALAIAAFNGMPVVRVAGSPPTGAPTPSPEATWTPTRPGCY